MGVIYKATCQINGKSYIGQTIRSLAARKKEHARAKDDYSIHKAIRKYGIENFTWEIVEECFDDFLDERETYWIAYYDTYYHGYNDTKGGDNANSLLKWKEEHKEEVKKNALNGLKYAEEYYKAYPEKRLKQLSEARERAVKACSRKVCCIDLNLVFDSLSDAERWSQTNQNPNGRYCAHQHISKVCKGQRKTAGGYKWKYI